MTILAVCTLSVLALLPRIFREHLQLTSISLAVDIWFELTGYQLQLFEGLR